jgi:glyoxylase-like metal-dependent hydrolase (beta-lactamase superfamily II)
MSAKNRTLLAGAEPTTPDVIFDRNMTLDLGGGVKVLLLWFGAAHTKGDELIFVETDRTLISGDVVQTRTVPFIFGEGGTPTSWLAVLDKILALNVAHVLPDHSEPGDGSLVATERNLITTLQSRALELKHRGVSVEDAGRQITAEMDREFPERSDNNATEFVKRVYADPSTP